MQQIPIYKYLVFWSHCKRWYFKWGTFTYYNKLPIAGSLTSRVNPVHMFLDKSKHYFQIHQIHGKINISKNIYIIISRCLQFTCSIIFTLHFLIIFTYRVAEWVVPAWATMFTPWASNRRRFRSMITGCRCTLEPWVKAPSCWRCLWATTRASWCTTSTWAAWVHLITVTTITFTAAY